MHETTDVIEPDVFEILPTAHALTGCDSTSKAGSKGAALQMAKECGLELLSSFGRRELTIQMIGDAEKFLVRCISPKHTTDSFDDLRCEIYHDKKFQFDLEKFPPTSDSIKEHIRRAYLQCHFWLHPSFVEDILLNPLKYGYFEDDKEHLFPGSCIPDDFPVPYNCLKCARANVCPCRAREAACCKFCKCEASES